MQTLTTLSLQGNKIGEQGAHHLANALQQNQVTSSSVHSIILTLFHTDPDHTEPRLQFNR
jgi:hypothetical protein